MRITDAKVIVTCPGRNFVTLKLFTEDGITGVGDATLNGRELAVASYLTDHVIPLLIGTDARRIELGGRCVRRGMAGEINDFVDRQPCPLSQRVELQVPNGLATGEHTLRARVFDAAGNGTTAYGPVKFTVATTATVTPLTVLSPITPKGKSGRLRVALRASPTAIVVRGSRSCRSTGRSAGCGCCSTAPPLSTQRLPAARARPCTGPPTSMSVPVAPVRLSMAKTCPPKPDPATHT